MTMIVVAVETMKRVRVGGSVVGGGEQVEERRRGL